MACILEASVSLGLVGPMGLDVEDEWLDVEMTRPRNPSWDVTRKEHLRLAEGR